MLCLHCGQYVYLKGAFYYNALDKSFICCPDGTDLKLHEVSFINEEMLEEQKNIVEVTENILRSLVA